MAQKQESQLPRESAEELMIRRFTGAQRDGIGRFFADPVSGRWSWSMPHTRSSVTRLRR
jgi:hypothetical protein